MRNVNRIYHFSSPHGFYYYQIIVNNGLIVQASGKKLSSTVYSYSIYDRNYNDLAFIIIGLISYPGIHLEKLKELYIVLNNGPEKDLVKSIQQSLIDKLTF